MPLLRKLAPEHKRTIGHWAMELLVVIAGVLIALWLQEWAERRRSLEQMQAAETAVHQEVTQALMSLIFRQSVAPCHLERAQLLKAALLRRGVEWRGLAENPLWASRPVGPMGAKVVIEGIYPRPVDTFTKAAWNSALATGALQSMNRDRFIALVGIYDSIDKMIENREIEDKAAATLSALSLPQQLTPEVRSQMAQALYDVDRTRFTFGLLGPEDLAHKMQNLGWNDRKEVDATIASSNSLFKRLRIRWRACYAEPRNPFK